MRRITSVLPSNSTSPSASADSFPADAGI